MIAGRRLLILACCLAITRVAAAQGAATLRGEVVQADSVTKAAGVVIVVLDTAGAEVARALTGQDGSFHVGVPAPARYSLRALRIGFRPTLVPAFEIGAGATHAVTVVLRGLAVQLSTVRVESGQGSCRISADAGLLVGNLWDQARTGLMASTLSAGGRPFQAELATYRQYVSHVTRLVEAETLTVVQQTSTAAFVSMPAESLAALGFVTVVGAKISYHAPDAQALLSPMFEASHCFDVRPGGDAHPDWMGITFRPARSTDRSDIRGVLWLDRATSELRVLEYDYTNLPRNAAGDDASGRVDFTRLVTGDWIVSRWWIRTPETELVLGGGRASRFRLVGRRVVGGYTRVVNQDAIQLYRDAGTRLSVTLRSTDTTNAVAGGYAGVVGTELGEVVNAAGTTAIGDLTEGTYTIVAFTQLMSKLGATPVTKNVTLNFRDSVRVEIPMPGMGDVAASACSPVTRTTLWYGTVENAGHVAQRGVRVAFEWTESRQFVAGRTVRRENVPVVVGTTTDANGFWHVCLARSSGVTLALSRGGQAILRRPVDGIARRGNTPIVLTVP